MRGSVLRGGSGRAAPEGVVEVESADELIGDFREEEVDDQEGVDADGVLQGGEGREGEEEERRGGDLDQGRAREGLCEEGEELTDEGADRGARVGDEVDEGRGEREEVLRDEGRVALEEVEGFLEGGFFDGGRVVARLDEELGEGEVPARDGVGALAAGGREGLGGEGDALARDGGVGRVRGDLLALAEFELGFLGALGKWGQRSFWGRRGEGRGVR